MAEAMETQAPYLPCFAASDPVFSAEECRKILAIGQAGPARAGVMQSNAGSGQPVYERGPDRDSAVTFLDPAPATCARSPGLRICWLTASGPEGPRQRGRVGAGAPEGRRAAVAA